MTWEYVIANPAISVAVSVIVGIILGWLFTWMGGRRRAKASGGELNELQTEGKSLRSERDAANTKVKKLQSDLVAGESSLTSARQQIATLQTEQDDMGAAKAAVEADLVTRSKEVEDLRASLAELQASYDLARSLAEAEGNTLREQIASLTGQIEMDKAVAVQAAMEYNLRLAELETAKQELDSLRAELLASESKVADTEAVIVTEHNEITTLQAELLSAQQKVEQTDIALDAAFARAAEVQRQAQTFETDLVSAEKEIESLRLDVDNLKALKAEADARVLRARGEVAGELALLTSTMIKMREESLGKANARITALTEEVAVLRSGATVENNGHSA